MTVGILPALIQIINPFQEVLYEGIWYVKTRRIRMDGKG